MVQREPVLNGLCNELWAVIAAQLGRRSVRSEEPRQDGDDVRREDCACHLDGQTLARQLVHHWQQLELGAGQARIMPKIIRPDVAGVGSLGRRRRAARKTPSTMGLGNLRFGVLPESMHALAIDAPAFPAQQCPHPPIAIARMALS